jgi:cytochrome o ubiquinol oxidase subunit 2
MRHSFLAPLAIFVIIGIVSLVVFLTRGHTVALLEPTGTIALAELILLQNALSLMVITGVAVFGLTFFFAWKYRASNTKAVYLPNWEHGALSELVWWAIPIEIVLILGALTWTSTHELDPSKTLSGGDPLQVQVVALDWKWLFIYPKEGIASVNEVRMPIDRPVTFTITADAPMNSFWIPQLGGQIYAMTGMSTHLNLLASKEGTYRGLSANYSGEGFSKMRFSAIATSEEEFKVWIEEVRSAPRTLSSMEYEQLRRASEHEESVYYAYVAPNLYTMILERFTKLPHEHKGH